LSARRGSEWSGSEVSIDEFAILVIIIILIKNLGRE
jgi:hypothetical protein